MRLLHVGCGGEPLPAWFGECEEVRLDINPDMRPDVCASMLDMGEIGEFDTLYTCHALEHLYQQDVARALSEFRRVLKPGGCAVVLVPNLKGIEPTDDVVYTAGCGPVTGHDMHYGMTSLIEANPHMAHHCGFVPKTLESAMKRAGFSHVETRELSFHNLLAVGVK